MVRDHRQDCPGPSVPESVNLPFRKFNLTPDQIEPMRRAFNKLCETLGLNWQPDDPVTDLIADKIMEVAATGDLDPDSIYAKVLEQLKGPTGTQSTA